MWLTHSTHFSSPVMRLWSHWYLRSDVINAIQISTLSWSWCGDNWCGIQTPYFHVLSNSLRCVSTAVWEYPSRSAKQPVASLGPSSISCFKTSTSTSSGLPECRESLSSKLPLLNRLKQWCAVRIQSMSSPIVLYTFLAASFALRSKRNSWSSSTRSPLHD